MRVVVTGAGGFVGRAVAATLAAAGDDVVGVYRTTQPIGLSKVHLVQSDLRKPDALPSRYDALIHCAADIPAYCPDPDVLYASNVDGSRAVFAHAHAAGAKRIVYCSSMSVYGTISVPIVDEATPTAAADAYGRSKLEGERLLTAVDDVAALSLRLPGVVGAGSHNNFLSSTLAKILRDEPVAANHPNALFNNVVHVADLAAFMHHWAHHGRTGHLAVPLAARDTMRIRDIMELMFAEAGKAVRISYSDTEKQPFTIATAASEALGYRPRTVRDSIVAYVADERAARG